jgi:hypothetical protein
MAPRLPRILSAVPQTLHVRLEIAKAVQATFGRRDDSPEQHPSRSQERDAAQFDAKLIKDCAHELRQEFLALLRSNRSSGWCNSANKAAVDDPKHPGWPAHTPGGKGGEFRPKDVIVASADEPGGLPPGIGHNQGPPLEEPPKIPLIRPPLELLLTPL